MFSRFEQATKDDINQSKQFEKILNDIRLSTLKYSGTEGYNEIKAVVNAASNASAEFFNTPKLEKKIIEAQQLSQKFKDCIRQELDRL